MMNYIWTALISLSFLISFFTGKTEQTASAAMEGAASTVETAISILGVMCFWMGMMRIAEKSNLLNKFSNWLKPLVCKLFKGIKRDETRNAVVMNITANLLGLGNAATPLGLKAMELMDKENGKKGIATNDMCLFVVLNTASIQLIPTTLFALRASFGSEKPYIVLPCVWLVSVVAAVLGIMTAKRFGRKGR
ncbi:MAG: hypothetical protein IKJ55_01245 [Clostridia bacterium]|nr:hypothetical protein [Clostridia bacterium]